MEKDTSGIKEIWNFLADAVVNTLDKKWKKENHLLVAQG